MSAPFVQAQEITGFQHGYLTFSNDDSALYYQVEFKPNLAVPEEWDGRFQGLRNIQSSESAKQGAKQGHTLKYKL